MRRESQHKPNRSHRVRSHHWVNGVLETRDMVFEIFEEAVAYAQSLECHTVKVYDPADRLLSEITNVIPNTYA